MLDGLCWRLLLKTSNLLWCHLKFPMCVCVCVFFYCTTITTFKLQPAVGHSLQNVGKLNYTKLCLFVFSFNVDARRLLLLCAQFKDASSPCECFHRPPQQPELNTKPHHLGIWSRSSLRLLSVQRMGPNQHWSFDLYSRQQSYHDRHIWAKNVRLV